MSRKIPIPREHGAWALLYGPFIVVAIMVGRLQGELIFFLVAVTAYFLAHEPLARLARRGAHTTAAQLSHWKQWLAAYLLVAAAATLPLLFYYQRLYLVPLGTVVSLLLLLHLYLIGQKQDRGIWGEIVGAIGLTASGPLTYYVLTGQLGRIAFFVWLLNVLYFTSGIFYVKMRVSRFSGKGNPRSKTWICILYHLFLAASLASMIRLELLPALGGMAFVPILIRAVWPLFSSPDKRLNFKKIGYSEVAYTVFFVCVLGTSLQLG